MTSICYLMFAVLAGELSDHRLDEIHRHVEGDSANSALLIHRHVMREGKKEREPANHQQREATVFHRRQDALLRPCLRDVLRGNGMTVEHHCHGITRTLLKIVRTGHPADERDPTRSRDTREHHKRGIGRQMPFGDALHAHPKRPVTEAQEGSSVSGWGEHPGNHLSLRYLSHCCQPERTWQTRPTLYTLHTKPHTHAAYLLHHRDTNTVSMS